jgi:hypothetical protein
MIAVLFARSDSVYKSLPECDVYDIDRDARSWAGGCPVVAHPPCRAWGRLRHFAKPRPDEKDLAFFAIDVVRKFGGVLEHPHASTLWPTANLPPPGKVDSFGGWTLPIVQKWWGHRAEKKTLLYIVGCDPCEIPDLPYVMGEASHTVTTSKRRDANGKRARPGMHTKEREHTPEQLAKWLVELAKRCRVEQ